MLAAQEDHLDEVVVVVAIALVVAVVAVDAADEINHHQENGHWLVEHNSGSPDDQIMQSPKASQLLASLHCDAGNLCTVSYQSPRPVPNSVELEDSAADVE